MAPEPTYNGINGNPHPIIPPPPGLLNNQVVVGDYGIFEEDRLEPIAVIGLSLEFPQEAKTPETFWKMLTEKRCAMTDWPKDRMNLDAFYHADGNRSDTISIRGGHFLKEPLGLFDAPFFSISSIEATAMDPQHRRLLETCYRAFENAGLPLERIFGSRTSVHTGCFTDDYRIMLSKDPDTLPKHSSIGLNVSLLAARLSWFFNLTGPCVNLDSACSSSMMAFDLACQGLRNGDSTMAVVAGANLAYSLEFSLHLNNMNFLSPDSRCFSFDDRANGYARGEGFGVVILKPLCNALKDGDTIRAVIRSAGSNQDGRTPGITQPSSEAQERLIRDTYEKAGLSLQFTRYIEAHGTGTAIGDPVEANAIGRAFRKYRSSEEPLYIGAIKSNLGHLEGASGVAGLIKTILILERGLIPPNANFRKINPKINTEALKVKFPEGTVAWPCQGLRRASVSSFGFGGSNSHVVLDDAYHFLQLRGLAGNHCTLENPPSLEHLDTSMRSPQTQAMTPHGSLPKTTLLIWSAADEGGLARLAKVYNAHFLQLLPSLSIDKANTYLERLAYTLAARRSSLSWKAYATISSISDLEDIAAKLSKPVRCQSQPKLGYIFTGQGAQHAEMAGELMTYPVFKHSLLQSQTNLYDLGCSWSLLDELAKNNSVSKINHPAYSQPLCTAIQIALVDLLRSFGIQPAAVIGHSSGEIAAAYCVGGLSHRSACKVSYYRGKHAATLASSTQPRGSMISVGLSEEEAERYLELLTLQFGKCCVVVGCVNSPKNVTLSGDEVQIDTLKLLLEKDQVFARKLQVDVAYHSPHMGAIASDYLQSIKDLQPGDHANNCIMISTVTGRRLYLDEMQQGEYWVKNMTSPVRFSSALSQISSSSAKKLKIRAEAKSRGITTVNDILEVGPHSALQGPIKDTLKMLGRRDTSYRSVLIRKVSAIQTILDAAGHLRCSGYPVDITQVNRPGKKPGDCPAMLVDLPEYPFDHSRSYWHESRLSKEGYRLRKHPRLDLLGTPVSDWNPLEARWRKFIRVSETPWVEDHKVNGKIIYPAAGMIVMALEASRQLADENRKITGYCVKDATFHHPLVVSRDNKGVEIQLYVRSIKDSSEKDSVWSEFRICIYEDGQWNENCRGTVALEYDEAITEVDAGKEAAALQSRHRQLFETTSENCNRTLSVKEMYEYLHDRGLEYGPAFQSLQQVSCTEEGEVIAEVTAFKWTANSDNTNHPQPHIIHPTTLDAVAQLMMVSLSKGASEDIPTSIPTRIGKIWISSLGISYPTSSAVNAYARASFTGTRKAESSMFCLDQETGSLLLVMEEVETTTVATTSCREANSLIEEGNKAKVKKLCYNLAWKPDLDLLESNAALLTYCEKARPTSRTAPVDFYNDLGYVLLMFISKTLDALTSAGREDLLDCSHSKSESGSQFHLHRYIQWMKRQIGKFNAGELPHLHPTNPKWAHLMEDTAYREALCDRLESTNSQGKLFIKVGRNLPKLSTGELEPLSFMFQEDSIPNYYREVNDDVFCFQPFARYLDAISHKNPALRVLEIGAGVGAVTGDVLGVLASSDEEQQLTTPRFERYDYTDISPAFFEKAEDTFKSHRARMHFKALDIEHDPEKQGFEAGSYDLVVAGSVLHATKNLEATLRNVRSLLKVGGKLALYELTHDQMRTGFAFGLLPGWWLGNEEYRQWSPCVSTNQWHDLLCRTGFSGLDIAIPDFLDPTCHEFSIVLATAVERVPAPALSNLPQYADTLIILAEHSLIQTEIANKIKEKLIAKNEAGSPAACDIVSLPEASATIKNLDRRFCIFLNELEKPLLANLDKDTFMQLQTIITTAPGILWVTNGGGDSRDEPQLHLIDGLARVCRTEFNKLVFVTLALENSVNFSVSEMTTSTTANKILRVFEKTVSESASSVGDFEPEYVENDGMLEIGRVSEAPYLNRELVARSESKQSKLQKFGAGPSLALHIASPGLLDSIQFIEDPWPTKPLGPGEIEIKVMATGVNFRDCLTALGQIDTKVLGVECAGIVSRIGSSECEFQLGDRVAACTLNTYRTYARAKTQCAIKIPDHISFLEASALPVVFVTAWHALCDLARLLSGETILIHAGAGGTGQAAIQIAKHLGAEIFVTVGSDAKKKLVTDSYQIPEDHIFYSRNTSFAQGIMRMTNNRGVDVILNSLSGKGLVASWECIAPFGRFIEIGKRDIHGRGKLPMFQFDRNALFTAIEFGSIISERPIIIQKCLQAVLALIAEKKLHVPRPFTVYGVSEIESAFRHFQSGRNSGKMVIEMRSDESVLTVLNATPKYQFDQNSTYLIAGGLGGLGRSAARWLVHRGAQHLILLSRSGARSQAAIDLIEELRAKGVQVEAPACDVTEADSLSTALAMYAMTMPPIRGCIQASMVLRDALMEKMSFEDWELSIRPKVSGSWNLHNLLPSDLEFFVCLSSIAGIIGSGAQANYAAGNAYMDALVHHRISRGQKATSIDLGWMESEGVIAENEFLQKGMTAAGFLMPISQHNFHALLDYHCDPTLDLPAPTMCQPIIGLETPSAIRAKGSNEPHWMQRRTFRHLRQMGLDEKLSKDTEVAVDYVSLFRNATSLGEATRILTEGLVKKLAKALSIRPDDVDTSKPLHAYGVDSLLAVELRNYFAKELGADVAIFDLMGGASFAAVGMTVASRSKYRHASWATVE